jgi:protein-S-isoprenylcysteine O-methyltransferase Ste14
MKDALPHGRPSFHSDSAQRSTGPRVFGVSGRRFADYLLFGVTSTELAILFILAPTFTLIDWIYVLQHVLVLGISLTRRPPKAQDRSLLTGASVVVAYGYSYAQVIYLNWIPGDPVWPECGLIMTMLAAGLTLASLLTLGRFFGIRPALRGLVTTGPYRIVRHPMYVAYIVGDIGYNLQESNFGTVLLMMVGWISLLYRIHAEEKILSQDAGWPRYVGLVRFRLLPGIW